MSCRIRSILLVITAIPNSLFHSWDWHTKRTRLISITWGSTLILIYMHDFSQNFLAFQKENWTWGNHASDSEIIMIYLMLCWEYWYPKQPHRNGSLVISLCCVNNSVFDNKKILATILRFLDLSWYITSYITYFLTLALVVWEHRYLPRKHPLIAHQI